MEKWQDHVSSFFGEHEQAGTRRHSPPTGKRSWGENKATGIPEQAGNVTNLTSQLPQIVDH